MRTLGGMGFGEKGLASQAIRKASKGTEVGTWSGGIETALGGFCHIECNKHSEITLAFKRLGDFNTECSTFMFE